MQAILLRLLIALLTFFINIAIVKMVTLAVRHVPAIKNEQKLRQQSRLGDAELAEWLGTILLAQPLDSR